MLGTPIAAYHPPENRTLQRHIAQAHLVMSQVPIVHYSRQDVGANTDFFPARNVTMSALTEATLIVKAGERSGALVQARHAETEAQALYSGELLSKSFTTLARDIRKEGCDSGRGLRRRQKAPRRRALPTGLI